MAATVVLLIALAAPVTAFAGGGGNCSACNVYSEPPVPSPGKQQLPKPTQPLPPQPPTGSTKTGGRQAHVPKALSRALALAGKDRKPLSQLLGGSDIGSLRSGSVNVGSPGALGAAFDLGVGPTVLLAILLATAALAFATRGTFRGWRLRRRPPSA